MRLYLGVTDKCLQWEFVVDDFSLAVVACMKLYSFGESVKNVVDCMK